MHRLEIEHISLRFGGVSALQDVGLHVDPGELVAIIGPNGAGKTSLINCISGVYRPWSGKVRFEGEDGTRLAPAARTRLGLARPFQNLALFQHLTELVEEIFVFLEIEHGRKKLVHTLSYGLQKRVERARALAREPKLLLLDEPMAGMNAEEKEDMARFILDVNEEKGTSILMIEHDMGVVMDLSHRIYVLNFGKKIAEGLPEEVRQNREVQVAYLGADAA